MNDRKIQNLCYEKWYRFVPIPNSTYSDKVPSVFFPVVIVTQQAWNLVPVRFVGTVRYELVWDLYIQLYSTAKLYVFLGYASQIKMFAVILLSI